MIRWTGTSVLVALAIVAIAQPGIGGSGNPSSNTARQASPDATQGAPPNLRNGARAASVMHDDVEPVNRHKLDTDKGNAEGRLDPINFPGIGGDHPKEETQPLRLLKLAADRGNASNCDINVCGEPMTDSTQWEIISGILKQALSTMRPGWKNLFILYYVDETGSAFDFESGYELEINGQASRERLTNINELDPGFRRLRQHLAQAGKQAFTTCTLSMGTDGKYRVEYGYDLVDWEHARATPEERRAKYKADAAKATKAEFAFKIDEPFSIMRNSRPTLVITGKVVAGKIETGDYIILPLTSGEKVVQIMGLEMLQRQLTAIFPGDMVAILVEGVQKADLVRGGVIKSRTLH